MAQLLDGNALAKEIRNEIRSTVCKREALGLNAPHLVAVLVGDNPASSAYVHNKIKDCKEVGFKSSLRSFGLDISQEELIEEIKKLNEDPSVDGFIVQLPLPSHIDEQKIILSVDSNKDVDGFHPLNIGKMLLGIKSFLPATPYGILVLLDKYHIKTKGKHVVVIGRSAIVGSPLSILMSRKSSPGNATVTLVHSHTENLSKHTQRADIVVAALGIPGFLKADMIKKGATVIDVGINRIKSHENKQGYKLVGDVKFDEVYPKADYITPVPGGVGPMTRAMLLKNTLWAVEKRR